MGVDGRSLSGSGKCAIFGDNGCEVGSMFVRGAM